MRFVVVLDGGDAREASTGAPWLGLCAGCGGPLQLEAIELGESDAVCACCGAIVGRVIAPARLNDNGDVLPLRVRRTR